jgi:hypothetical protein
MSQMDIKAIGDRSPTQRKGITEGRPTEAEQHRELQSDAVPPLAKDAVIRGRRCSMTIFPAFDGTLP